jgi:DNA-binding Lrp family transcriptional regulator
MDELLKILEDDARTTPESIAKMTGKTEAEVRDRIAEYERAGVIKHYKTVIDWDRTGADRVLAFIDVKVTPKRDVGFDDVAERIFRYPQVLSVWLVSGDYDLRVVVGGKNLQDVSRFVSQNLSTMDRVHGTSTHFMLKRYKEDNVVFAEEHADPRLAVSP